MSRSIHCVLDRLEILHCGDIYQRNIIISGLVEHCGMAYGVLPRILGGFVFVSDK